MKLCKSLNNNTRSTTAPQEVERSCIQHLPSLATQELVFGCLESIVPRTQSQRLLRWAGLETLGLSRTKNKGKKKTPIHQESMVDFITSVILTHTCWNSYSMIILEVNPAHQNRPLFCQLSVIHLSVNEGKGEERLHMAT